MASLEGIARDLKPFQNQNIGPRKASLAYKFNFCIENRKLNFVSHWKIVKTGEAFHVPFSLI